MGAFESMALNKGREIMNDSYHISLSTEIQSYDINLTRTDRPELIALVIAGRGYAISSDQTVSSLIRDRLSNLSSRSFENLESFRTALLKSEGEVLKIQKVAVEALGTDPSDSKLIIEEARAIEGGLVVVEGKTGLAIDRRLQKQVSENDFSGSVCVIKKGKIVLQKSYGLASEGQENAPDTTFRIASLSKTVVGAAILRLHDQGKLDINAKIPPKFLENHRNWIREEIETLKRNPSGENQKRIEELNEQVARFQSITITQILNHTSGLGGSTELYRCFGREIPDYGPLVDEHHNPQELLDAFLQRQLISQPGEVAEYSNIGYLLLGLIIEDASEKPIKDYMEQMFTELKMEDSSFPLSVEEDVSEAVGYDTKYIGESRFEKKPVTGPDDCSFRFASGNIISSIVDLARFERALSRDKDSEGFLSADTLGMMVQHGYGWDVFGMRAEEWILGKEDPRVTGDRGWVIKDGEMDGAHAMLISFQDIDSSIIILGNTNMNNFSEGVNMQGSLGPLSNEIAKILMVD